MRRFEYVEGSSSKFWEAEQDGSDLNIRWGRIGTAGQSQTKAFADANKAAAALIKLIDEKTGKGYVEAVAAAGASIGKTADKPKADKPKPEPAAETVAAPATSPASPGAAAPHAAAAQVAAPQPAPVAAPNVAAVATNRVADAAAASVAAASDTPPWLTDGAPLDIGPDLIKLALATRRHPKPIADTDPLKLWLAAREILLAGNRIELSKTDPAWQEALAEAGERLQSRRPDGSDASTAALLALTMGYGDRDAGVPFVGFLVARHGLLKAVEHLLEAQRSLVVGTDWDRATQKHERFLTANPDRPLGSSWHGPLSEGELAFREHLAAAPQALYDECARRIVEVLPQLHPSRQISMALLLPDRPELSNELAHRYGGNGAPAQLHWLQLSATDPAAIAIARKVKIDGYTPFFGHEDMVATVLIEHGVEALDRLAPGAGYDAAGEALVAIGTPDAIEALAAAASMSKNTLARLTRAVNRWPSAAMVGLARVIANGGKDAVLLGPSLTALLRARADQVPALRPWLSPAAAQTIDKLLAQLSGPAETAAPDELPPVLAAPPWLGTRPKVLTVTGLEPLPLAAVEHWTPAEREAALDLGPWKRERFETLRNDAMAMTTLLGFKQHDVLDKSVFQEAAKAIRTRDSQALIEAWRRYKAMRTNGGWSWMPIDGTEFGQLPEELALPVWNALAGEGDSDYGVDYMLARFGLAALPGVSAAVRRRPSEHLQVALHVGTVEFAPLMARAFAKLKSVRDIGRRWLLANPEYAACGLIAPAIGKAGEARDCAASGLRLLDEQGHGALLREVAARYQREDVSAALEAMLIENPLDRYPSKRPPLPTFWQPRGWRRPVLRNGKALPDQALDHVGTMFAFPTNEGVYPGIEQLREACIGPSLADFGWDAFGAWLYAGAPSKDSWAMNVLALIGNDETARRLTPYIRAWPGEAAHARAVAGLDVLAGIGSDVALMLLNGIAQKVKFKGLQDKAREKIEEIAQARGLSAEELEDRLAPDLGLDEHGTMLLDFGTRQFRVGFDEALKPYVRDSEGARLADLPKPKKSDDAELSKQATERFKLLKKDVRTIASQQVLRLEVAMCSRRRWTVEVFEQFLAGHPLLRHLVQRLVWGVYEADADDAGYGGRLRACFRVAEDASYTTAGDDGFELPRGDSVRIGLPHALELPAADAAAFGQLFADYELLQPFAQMGRDVHALEPAEREQDKLLRWKGVVVPTGRVLGLVNKGWRRGTAQDGGGIWYFSKPLGRDWVIELTLDPGIIVGMVDEYPEQTLQEVQIGKPSSWGNMQTAERLSGLDPISASELIRDLEALRA
ncbi:Molybdate metabolism regulator [Lysobacter capsici AZ78]|uniref:Molybdate metabolism regulator n=1 Tax=Lysobacter capsici AZ78 TaxID=1444315 RepID=A0A108U848_9GAMM|nr:DUF4132 domain-containing protein [Lysobacter capsici]KWS04320.1 Molybdate metabolism regulator [Lysobacter capsici AZ78]